MSFSYPGYSEMFCGWPDDDRIDSNDPVPNPNVSVLEVVNQDPRYKAGDFPIAEQLAASVLSLPMHTELDNEQLAYITEQVLRAVEA